MENRPAVNATASSKAEIEVPEGSRAWLWGAYTLLTVWSMAYLVLFFTDRLPF